MLFTRNNETVIRVPLYAKCKKIGLTVGAEINQYPRYPANNPMFSTTLYPLATTLVSLNITLRPIH